MFKKGYKQTPEHAAARKGYVHSEETRKKISESHRGLKHSEETKKKMSEAKKGKKLSPEHCKNIGEAEKGFRHSEETKKKISESVKNHGPVSEETKAKHRGHIVTEETRAKISKALKGEKSPNWKGGIANLPYCVKFNNNLKERVRNFYGRKCVECGKTEEQNGKKHCVHHVNFNKNTCCDNSKPLFVILCMSCHNKTNFNREYWEERYTNLINDKYNGKCYYTTTEAKSLIINA